MSLAINIDAVSAVLLADGWHQVADASFLVDSYEYIDPAYANDERGLVHGGGQSGVCASGFGFYEDLDENAGNAYRGDLVRVAGPLTAILAVQERRT
jgi:hypothetical protein